MLHCCFINSYPNVAKVASDKKEWPINYVKVKIISIFQNFHHLKGTLWPWTRIGIGIGISHFVWDWDCSELKNVDKPFSTKHPQYDLQPAVPHFALSLVRLTPEQCRSDLVWASREIWLLGVLAWLFALCN